MKKFLTEYDELQAALKRVRIDEEVMPYYNGRLVERVDTYKQMQAILDCDKMSDSHKYLLDLDASDIDDEDAEKIDRLYKVGLKHKYFDDFQDDGEGDYEDDDEEVGYGDEAPEDADGQASFDNDLPCWTVLYSATKDGETKCGECYSNASSSAAARIDCQSKL